MMHELTGKCAELTQKIADRDPSLTRVRGHYVCPIWGSREHWWLKTQEGTIIDPTVEQFPSRGRGEYQEWNEGDAEPTGLCMNCGGYVFNNSFTCSEDCYVTVRKDYP